MFFIYFKTTTPVKKLFFLIAIAAPCVVISFAAWGTALDEKWGPYLFGLGAVLLVLLIPYYFLMKRSLKKLMTYGNEINDSEERVYFNIDLKREAFTPDQWKEYREYYANFYKKIERML